MTRYYYGQNRVVLAARELFGWQEDYADEKYSRYRSAIALRKMDASLCGGDLGEEGRPSFCGTPTRSQITLCPCWGFADERTKKKPESEDHGENHLNGFIGKPGALPDVFLVKVVRAKEMLASGKGEKMPPWPPGPVGYPECLL